MGLMIQDGTGKGVLAEVTSENRLLTEALTSTRIAGASLAHGSSYIWNAYQDWGADVNAIWQRNDSADEILFLDKISVSPPATAIMEIWVGSGNTAAGTVVTGVNLNRTSGSVALATCRHTNTNVDAGAGMTLLATYVFSANAANEIDFRDALILGRNDEVALNMVTDVAATAVNVIGYFHD